jgi:Fe-S cluster assembly ATP-binding protein
MTTLQIKGLRAGVAGREILRGIDLTVSSGEVHAVMGPNGAGKSTLSAVVMGRPGYEVLAGEVTLDGRDVLSMPTWERAAGGLHLVMQYPSEVPGVAVDDMLREAMAARHAAAVDDLDALLLAEADRIELPEALLHRALNVEFSGGEKKRNETLQLAVLQPRIAILDELDSGLDIDALRACARRIEAMTEPHGDEPGMGVLAITHYNALLKELRPDRVHILVRGELVAEGGPELADELELSGYAAYTTDEAPAADVKPVVLPGSLDELFSTR